MITVVQAELTELGSAGVMRSIRSDLSPVNSASRDLAIVAGGAVTDRLESIGVLPLGGAVITPGGNLPATFLIHVVVMTEDEPQTAATVQKALQNGLRRASDLGLDSLALPPIGMGAGLIEPEVSARALVEFLYNHLDEGLPPQDLTIAVSSSYEVDLFSQLVLELARDRTT
ncbi:MAG: macro domain-containing protein [Gemmatimonadetes bacterium]|nr:macro domain-containing protein [Gemmatimonadota bacterium]MDA1104166.1 macro domain-containing protein [Gemmatimonadota bacterium]